MNRPMKTRNPPRYQGTITSWKDEQGFGFIAPNGGGPAVFVHIKSFAGRATRPAVDDIVTFELGVNEKGQPRASNVAFVREHSAQRMPARSGPGQLLVAAAFIGLLAIAVVAGIFPDMILLACFGISALTFIVYALDKSAARHGRWRTAENTLHLLALAGGWPGAMLAQQLLRHKSTKASFRAGFWRTVVVNCAVVGWLATPSGRALLGAL